MSCRVRTCLTAWLALGLLPSAELHAQITLDGSVGSAGALSGPDYAIPADLGTQVGGNLLHSFATFNLNTGESATFTGPATVDTIIGRVTGGAASLIDGTLRSEIAGADVYFVNPAGIVFGPGARLDIGGSFYASTAAVLHLSDGGQVVATRPADSVLTAAAPRAFGFLDAQPAAVTLTGGVLQPAAGARLGVVAGDLVVNGGALTAPGGRIDLVSVGGPATVLQQADGALEPTDAGQLGTIDLSNVSFVGVLGGNGVFVRAARLNVASGAQINNSVLPDSTLPGGIIDIRTTDSVTLTSGGLIGSITQGDAAAGAIFVDTPRLTIVGDAPDLRSGFITTTSGNGAGGDITLQVGELTLLGSNSGITSGTSGVDRLLNGESPNSGAAGRITINAERIQLSDGATIDSSSFFSDGRGGDIVVTASESLQMRTGTGATNSSGFSSFASGNGRAGDITVTTPLLTLMGSDILANTSGVGDAGNITLVVEQLTLTDGSDLGSNSIGLNPLTGELNTQTGKAGAITITAQGDLLLASGSGLSSATINGTSGAIFIDTPGTVRVDSGVITATTVGDSDAGAIRINAGRVILTGNTLISSVSGTFLSDVGFLGGSGRAGQIDIQAGEGIDLGPGSIVTTFTAGGDGGRITLITPGVLDNNGGVVRASTIAAGEAGAIVIEAGAVRMSNAAQLDSSTLGSGRGGNVTVTAATIDLQSGSRIAALSGNTDPAVVSGDAGTISLTATGTLRLTDSTITSQAGQAGGGDIAITAGSLQLRNSPLTASVASGSGGGGNLTLTARTLVALTDSDLTARADQGFGGRITLNADVFFRDPTVDLNASSNVVGNEGVVEVNAPELDLSSGLAALPESYLAADTLLPAPCGTRQAGTQGSLTVSGQSRVGLTPDDLLPGLTDPVAVAMTACDR